MLLLSVLNGLVAMAYFACARLLPERAGEPIAPRLLIALGITWVAHMVLIAMGELAEPHFGFASTLSLTTWLTLGVYWFERFWLTGAGYPRWLALAAALAIVLRLIFRGNQALDWEHLPTILHWSTGVAAYGLVAAAMMHGFALRSQARALHRGEPGNGMPLLTLERLTFSLLRWGFVLLTISITAGLHVLGGKSLHDHNLAFSALAWLLFAVLLVGRHFAGWRGPTALRLLNIGSTCLLLAYIGARFVFELRH